MAEVGDGAGRANIRKHQMLIVPGSSSSFGGEIGRAVRTDGGDEAQLLFVDHASHIVCQDAHRVSFIAVSANAVRPEMVGANGFHHATSRSSPLLRAAAYNISKMSYRTIFGGSLSPTPTARILLSQAYRSAPVSNIGATRK